MAARDGLLHWSLPAGRWGGTRVRLSVLLPLAGLAACLRTGSFAAGGLTLLALLTAAIVHELARGAAAAWAGQPVTDTLLWPLGGLEAPVHGPPRRPSAVHIAGPTACMLTTGGLVTAARAAGYEPNLWDEPWRLATPDDAAGLFSLILMAVGLANWLPAWPLACGRTVRDMIAPLTGTAAADRLAVRLTHAVGTVTLLLAVGFGSAWAAAGCAVVMLLARVPPPRPPAPRPRPERDTFLGYDFSAGYTSLERSAEPPGELGGAGGEDRGNRPAEPDLAHDAPVEDRLGEPLGSAAPRVGPLAAWRLARAARRAAAEADLDRAALRAVDDLLAKISRSGADSLTPDERRTLTRAADRLRDRRGAPPPA